MSDLNKDTLKIGLFLVVLYVAYNLTSIDNLIVKIIAYTVIVIGVCIAIFVITGDSNSDK
ncbi:hypothetical protein [Mesoflavibacter sp. CH_XMU1422-2]|uniref:hypothetical protein n=1 Tax=Mesoflavibacter sp. CH_XMU1422-2 TaxID=3107770 RepID=UPI0030080721